MLKHFIFEAFRQKNPLKIALQVSKIGFSPIVMPLSVFIADAETQTQDIPRGVNVDLKSLRREVTSTLRAHHKSRIVCSLLRLTPFLQFSRPLTRLSVVPAKLIPPQSGRETFKSRCCLACSWKRVLVHHFVQAGQRRHSAHPLSWQLVTSCWVRPGKEGKLQEAKTTTF